MKMKKQIKIILISLIMFLAVISVSIYSNATQTPTVGTINFKAISNTDSKSVSNLKVTVYQIGKKTENGFEFSDSFVNANINTSDFSQENFDKIQKYAESNAKPIYTKKTDNKGEFSLKNIELGIYLFVQSDSKDKVTMQTIMVMLPEAVNNAPINYNVTVKPKIVSIPQAEISTNNSGSVSSTAVTASSLPYTGILNWPIPVLVVIAIVLFSIGWLKLFTNSKKKVN